MIHGADVYLTPKKFFTCQILAHLGLHTLSRTRKASQPDNSIKYMCWTSRGSNVFCSCSWHAYAQHTVEMRFVVTRESTIIKVTMSWAWKMQDHLRMERPVLWIVLFAPFYTEKPGKAENVLCAINYTSFHTNIPLKQIPTSFVFTFLVTPRPV